MPTMALHILAFLHISKVCMCKCSGTPASGCFLEWHHCCNTPGCAALKLTSLPWIQGAQIAKGAFGQVHAATYTPHSSSKVTTATVVVKQLLPKYAKNDMQCKVFMDEAVICQYLEDIECAGVVKFHGLVLGSDWFGIVQEMYEGSLASELGKHKVMFLHAGCREACHSHLQLLLAWLQDHQMRANCCYKLPAVQ